jgi:hypothetical protein
MKAMVAVGPPRLASVALPEDAATPKKYVIKTYRVKHPGSDLQF